MTSEFKIDRPGVYKMRNGNRVPVWCNAVCENMGAKWMSLGHQIGMAWNDKGRRYYICESDNDIVAYVGPLPTEILARMREALALAEGDEPQSPTVEQRLRHKCSVCGEWPNERGVLHHGRGCYVTHKGGGGCTYVDFEQEPKQ